MEHLQDRLSKWQIMTLSRELHHDEDGIGKVCDLMLCTEAQSAYNAAWMLYHFRWTERTKQKEKTGISHDRVVRMQSGGRK